MLRYTVNEIMRALANLAQKELASPKAKDTPKFLLGLAFL